MQSTLALAATTSKSDPRWFVAILGLCAVWALPIWHFSFEWNLNPQYHYGWIVPLLSLYLVRLRKADCPRVSLGWEDSRRRAKWMIAALVVLYFPLIVFQVANPEWRPLGYVIAIQAILITGLGVYLSAGWNVAWHFAFPLAFFLVAVPWPRPLDAPLMDFLMGKNAGAAVEGLLWQGIAASRKGNLVILPSGTVGVDEACSGIRSLQGTFMLALFLGEMFRLTVLRRAALVVAAAAIALTTNTVRTFMLARVAATGGVDTVESWHDSAGYTILLLNFVCLCLVTAVLCRLPKKAAREFYDQNPLQQWWAKTSRHSGVPASQWQPPALLWSWGIPVVIVLSMGFGHWWYARDHSDVTPLVWRVEEPVSAEEYKRQRIPDKVHIALRDDGGWTGRWRTPENLEVQAWYLRWEPGRNAAQLANMHDPRTCVSALGLDMQAELGTWVFRADKLALPVQTFRFRDGPQIVHVYYALLNDVPAGDSERRFDNSFASRIDAAWHGVKHRGQRLVEVAIWGDVPESKARSTVEQFLAAHTLVEDSA